MSPRILIPIVLGLLLLGPLFVTYFAYQRSFRKRSLLVKILGSVVTYAVSFIVFVYALGFAGALNFGR